MNKLRDLSLILDLGLFLAKNAEQDQKSDRFDPKPLI